MKYLLLTMLLTACTHDPDPIKVGLVGEKRLINPYTYWNEKAMQESLK